MKYNVGDKVRIRKDLEVRKFYGRCFFVPEMQGLCGKTTRIAKVLKDDGCYYIDSSTKCWTDEMFEDVDTETQKMNKRVIIDVDGNKVIARYGDKEGVARCHPDDTFDFYIGAKIALERLKEAEKPYAWLELGVKYYFPVPAVSDLYNVVTYTADDWDKRIMKRGIAFRTKEEAVECAKKMLAAVK